MAKEQNYSQLVEQALADTNLEDTEVIAALFAVACKRIVDRGIAMNNMGNFTFLDGLRRYVTDAQRYGLNYIGERIQRALEKDDESETAA